MGVCDSHSACASSTRRTPPPRHGRLQQPSGRSRCCELCLPSHKNEKRFRFNAPRLAHGRPVQCEGYDTKSGSLVPEFISLNPFNIIKAQTGTLHTNVCHTNVNGRQVGTSKILRRTSNMFYSRLCFGGLAMVSGHKRRHLKNTSKLLEAHLKHTLLTTMFRMPGYGEWT